jgi:uncharacterized membrane protein
VTAGHRARVGMRAAPDPAGPPVAALSGGRTVPVAPAAAAGTRAARDPAVPAELTAAVPAPVAVAAPVAVPAPVAVVALAAVVVLAEVVYPLVHGQVRAACTAVAVTAGCAASLAHAGLTRGPRVAAALLAAFAAGGWLTEVVGLATGVPFGGYRYTGSLGPAALGVPVLVPLAWCMAAWPAYVAALHLAPGLPRAARVPLAAAALAAWDLFLDPQMVAAGHWVWRHPEPALPGVAGVPLTNYAGWLVAALAMAAAFEMLAGPSAAGRGRDAVPLALYLWTYGSSVLAHAAFFGLPGSALSGGAGMGLVAVPLAVALARGRWAR